MEHSRIALLRNQVAGLPIDDNYRQALYRSIDLYADQILLRPQYGPGEGWDDLEALQQVTLGNILERALQAAEARALQRRNKGQTSSQR